MAQLILAFVLFLAHAATAGAETVVVGHSASGTAIVAKRFGNPAAPRTALVVGQVHGDEPGGLRVTRALRHVAVGNVDLWVIDSANPDGGRRGTRQNGRGVDLNRNFPYRWVPTQRGTRYYGGQKPLSEPESRALSSFILRVRPDVTIWYHQPYDAVLVPCDHTPPLQRLYARLAGMSTSCRGAGLRGTIMTWQNHDAGGHAFVVELAGGAVSDAVAERNARAAAAVAASG